MITDACDLSASPPARPDAQTEVCRKMIKELQNAADVCHYKYYGNMIRYSYLSVYPLIAYHQDNYTTSHCTSVHDSSEPGMKGESTS